MAEPSSYMDPRTSKASTKPDQVKNVKDSNFGSPIQTKNIGLTKNPKQESKTDYSGNPKEFIHGLPNKYLSSVYTSHLTHLEKLDLSGRGLTKLPDRLWECDEVEELNLSNNPLDPSFIFPMLSRLQDSLKKLDLSGCGLTKLPEDFGKYWYKLEELNLSNNPLGPSFIFPMLSRLQRSLKKLDLSGCGLKEWPCASEKCSSLQELDLSNNSIGHEELLKELNSGKMCISHLSSYKSGKGPFGPMTRIFFEDTVLIQRNGG